MGIRTWLRSLITTAPADDISVLDALDGIRPPGEVPPLTPEQSARLPFADWDQTRDEIVAEHEEEGR